MPGYWLVPPQFPLIEPVGVPEVYVTAPAGFWYDGIGNITTPCYREEIITEAPEAPPSRIVKVKILWPHASLEAVIDMLKRCRTLAPPIQPAPMNGPNLHRVR